MNKVYLKDLFRSIYHSKARFFSILTIIAIGVGFFAGINATEPDMIQSANKYYKDTNLSDFRVVAPLGFQEEEIAQVKKMADIEQVQEGYWKDLFLTSSEGDTSITRLYSYNQTDFQKGEGLNHLTVTQGRLPENPGEIVVQAGGNVPEDITVGSEVTLSVPEEQELKDSLKTSTFTVVGTIHSPMYISFERGQTNIGDGSVDFFAYINANDFALERVTDLFIETKESKDLTAYTEEYQEHLNPIQASLEQLGVQAMSREIDKLEKELNDGKAELEENRDKAEQELADAEQKLVDSEKEIQEGEEQLNEEERNYREQLDNSRKQLEEGEAQLEAGKLNYQEKYQEWQDGNEAYEQGIRELNTSKEKLDETAIQLEQGEQELAIAKQQLDEAKEQLDLVEESISSLNVLEEELIANPPADQEEFIQLVEQLNIFPEEIVERLRTIDYPNEDTPRVIGAIDNFISQLEAQYEEAKEAYEEGLAEYEAGVQQLEAGREEYENGLAKYEAGLAELSAVKKTLDDGKQELENAKLELEAQEQKLEEGKSALEAGEEEFNRQVENGREELAAAKEELEEGWETFEQEKATALEEIEEAEKEIEDGEKAILDIPTEWLVSTREANPGYSGYGDDAERIGAVAKIFPLFFFLVAALVCLTTMTRMIEEERTQIGSMKALGYGTFTIASKYLIYALASSLIGALIGLSVGFKLFPTAIMNAYGIMYTIPERLTPYHWNYAVVSIAIALITTVVAALFATIQELKATPAVLMQPRAPKPGKRIFLEKIAPLWSRLSFSHKVTFRNLFRYKRRFYMTILGISGCTALLIAGFGLSDSINDIMGKQYSEIFLYDGQVLLDTKKDQSEESLLEILENQEDITSFMPVYNESVDAMQANSDRAYETHIMVPNDQSAVDGFIQLQDRKSQRSIEFPSEGAVITEKLSSILDVDVGDTLRYRDTNNNTYEMEVAAITEHYLSHYIYLSPEYAEEITGNPLEYNAWMFRVKDTDTVDKPTFKEEFMNNEAVMSVYFNEDISQKYQDTMESLDYVVLILIISAAALAFVVLYNLTNINITERIREIATIKVLGFRNKEVDAYVYRENFILTLFGTIFGLILGTILHQYVIITMEIDSMMFGRQVHFSSYIWSIILTIIFATSVNFFMHYKLKNLDMVESLKSVD